MGYFQYAALYAAVGAAFNTEEEAQQTQSLMSLILVPSMLLMFPVMASPDAKFAVIVSLIPVFSPVLFFTRMTVRCRRVADRAVSRADAGQYFRDCSLRRGGLPGGHPDVWQEADARGHLALVEAGIAAADGL